MTDGDGDYGGMGLGDSRISQENLDDIDHMLEKLAMAQSHILRFINQLPALLDNDEEFEKLRSEVNGLVDKIYSIVGPLVEAKNENEKRIKQLEASYGELLYHFEGEQKKVESFEQQIRQLTAESAGQVTFCTHMGAVLGNLIWKSARSSSQVEQWLNENRQDLNDFISITTTALESFLQTFGGRFPDIKEQQCQFMMSLMGTITNVSANSTGRQMLCSQATGKSLISLITKSIPNVPSTTGDPMKRLMLMILYNISLNCTGLPFLLSRKVHELIPYCTEESPEIQLNALRLIQSITYDIKETEVVNRLLELLPLIKIHEFMSSRDDRIAEAARGLMTNINKFFATAETISNTSTEN
ncbi:uncharacterized protein [Fopius arisanus]|uniref:Uncharacterized protein n=1 Tax=Fopius arisanus TaxID=64838 RepID=A0A9R1U1W6_9HYME|nr:PREDICTED: uncharacterized protein LOC105267811 [Fopius arisanus]